MNNSLNSRITRLIKDDLLDYGKHLLGFLGVLIASLVINIGLNRGIGAIPEVLTIDLGNFGEFAIDFGEFAMAGIFNTLSFGFFIIIMFISGIVIGYELPQHVRRGVARKEYFIATTIAAVIVSLLIIPLLLLMNMIFNIFANSGSTFLDDGRISMLVMQFLMYIVLFLFGYCIAIIWQRVGWQLGIVTTVVLLSILSFLGWQTGIIFTLTADDYYYWLRWSFSNIFLVGMTMALAIATYTLIRGVSVKSH